MSSMQKSEGKDLGDYVLLKKKIGSGSYADVYQGYRKSDKETVAIKVISKNKLNQKLNSYLELEIQTLKKIDHSSVIKLYEVQRSSKHIYLIMEFCAGGTLSMYIRDVIKGKLPEKTVNSFMYEITKGLKYMSEKSLIHRDLKPQNILITDNNDPHIKIADFGFARYLLGNDLAETQCGSPLYMAPEVLKGEKYNSKADLWSLSAILYEMFEGKPPFKALNVLQLIKIIETATIDYSGIPSKNAVDLMKKLFVLNPEKRLSFDEFYNHPYIQEILLEKEPFPLKPIPQKSPKHPKTSPFKKEDFDTKMVDDFLVIESKPALLASLLSSGTSGYVIYPTTIFDFSTSNYEKENEEQCKIIIQIESIALQSWSIAELAMILERAGGDRAEPLSLYLKALFHLYDIVRYVKHSVPQELLCERINDLVSWSKNRYFEFLEYANKIPKISNSSEVSPEELLYKYAMKLTKEAAFAEYLNNTDSNSLNMYNRCVYVIEYLISIKKFTEEDRKWFKSLVLQLKSRIENFSLNKQK